MSSPYDFQLAITKERERLTGEREEFEAEIKTLEGQIKEIEGKIAAINRELHALDVYEQARTGKPAVPKYPRGTHRETVLSLIAAHNGLAPKEIKDKLGQHTPKGLHNLLATLKKHGKLKEEGGKYTVAPTI